MTSYIPMQDIAATVAGLREGRLRARALVDRAQQAAGLAERFNPIAHADWRGAQEAADELDRLAARGTTAGPLHGIVLSIKDLYNVRGMPTRAGTRAPLPDLGQDEATAVERLRAAGAIVFGKTNMHEIALGATGENVWTGDVMNPHDPSRQSGGSSSGAAVAVATGVGFAGLGSDTGGSVRIPAAFCGVVGFKPTFGAIPLDGALPLSWTCDHAGPIANTVADCATLYEVMARRRADHARVARAPRLAVPARWLAGRLDPAVRDRFDRVLAVLRAAGASIDEVDIASMPLAWTCYTPIVRAEAAHVHARALVPGVGGFSPMVLAPLQAGQALSAGEYLAARDQRRVLRAELMRVTAAVDALLLPTSPVPAPRRGQAEVMLEGGSKTVREAVLGQTLPFSLCGLPALSVPMGRVDGLPVGLQLVAGIDADASLLALGRWVEAQRIADRTPVE